jgi:hypothetical protein
MDNVHSGAIKTTLIWILGLWNVRKGKGKFHYFTRFYVPGMLNKTAAFPLPFSREAKIWNAGQIRTGVWGGLRRKST